MATGSVLRCHNPLSSGFTSNPQPPTIRDFHSFSSQHISSEPIYIIGQDVFRFYQTFQIPERLRKRVSTSNAIQIMWFRKLIDALNNSEQIPQTSKEVSQLIIKALKDHPKAEVEELLSFYGLPLPHTLACTNNDKTSKSWAKGVKLELHTLPVDGKAVADGDTLTVYVRASDRVEVNLVPSHVLEANRKRKQAKAMRNYVEANALHQQIIDSGYRVLKFKTEEVLAHKYRIRLRGIDAPESEMPYGKEAREELTKIVEGKSLRILLYETDCYGRFVGDIYYDNIFVQELMLKKGCAWYYSHYDSREELRKWENEAKVKQAGLWAFSNPEEPWEWRKNQRHAINTISHLNHKKIAPPKLQMIHNSCTVSF